MQRMPRLLSELEIRATAHASAHHLSVMVGDDLLKDISDGKISPSKAYNLVYRATSCQECAKCGRWLAIIARDYGSEKAHQVRELTAP